FEAATMRQILSHYKTILKAMMRDLEGRVNDTQIPKKPTSIELSGGMQQECATQKDAIESRLVEIWEAVLGNRPIGVNDDFFELGGDSLRAARLFALIKQSFGRAMPLGTLFQAPTIATLAKVISDSGSTDCCVVAIQAGNARPPLFCAHGQSGSLIMYRNL